MISIYFFFCKIKQNNVLRLFFNLKLCISNMVSKKIVEKQKPIAAGVIPFQFLNYKKKI